MAESKSRRSIKNLYSIQHVDSESQSDKVWSEMDSELDPEWESSDMDTNLMKSDNKGNFFEEQDDEDDDTEEDDNIIEEGDEDLESDDDENEISNQDEIYYENENNDDLDLDFNNNIDSKK
jgi:ribonuclease E